mmetsp:Transcript_58629/g.143723  ORF Transcript_58629/g.143723 Transcript_58629/m.143723 type:complete len:175 (+) Transcript_58629:182-706(+)|eukprot:CAMPEP_0206257992 /NCGR_PEP_ID=MMETSP0047_2-20121206/25667_1 /ASSEMBLY_ACC=CAM_ASM_000192 /TAXON_ID=195065 /ORGANISM="Chroomonas mesostigmatica_cf, Strain CCMP1168" /LENGTH=174 /DNA_ID=CAMNT_0053684677 /DNA_START=119 /DNA_END=643 /DNA_ORIENTATION=-
MSFCGQCGAHQPKPADFCAKCGAPSNSASATAAVLAPHGGHQQPLVGQPVATPIGGGGVTVGQPLQQPAGAPPAPAAAQPGTFTCALPPGAKPGQVLSVTVPAGCPQSGLMAQFCVPDGVQPGGHVRVPLPGADAAARNYVPQRSTYWQAHGPSPYTVPRPGGGTFTPPAWVDW